MLIKDKTIVVTGAGSGIGRALVDKFTASGAAHIVAVDINADNVAETAAQYGCTAMTANVEGNDGVRAAAVDGMMEANDVADCVVQGIEAESFLILPHSEVAGYMKRKTDDYDRWISGMNRLHCKLTGEA